MKDLTIQPRTVYDPRGIIDIKPKPLADKIDERGVRLGVLDNSKWNAPDHSIDATAYALSQLEAEIDRLRAQGKAVFVFMSPHKGDPEFTDDVATLVDRRLKENQSGFYIRGDFLNQDEYFYDGVHYEVSGHNIAGTKISNHMSEKLR